MTSLEAAKNLPRPANQDLSPQDESQLLGHGISLEEAQRQLELLRDPPPPLHLDRPTTVGDGIQVLPQEEHRHLLQLYDTAAAAGRASKFVPASGAASRMFHSLIPYCRGAHDGRPKTEIPAAQDPEVRRLLDNLESFAFFPAVACYLEKKGASFKSLHTNEEVETFLEALLTPRGMNYANAPKALIPFHRYGETTRTAFEEQLLEAAASIADAEGRCRLHFTVVPEAEEKFQAHAEAAQTRLQRASAQAGAQPGNPSGIPSGRQAGSRFEISYSAQSPSTDTLAVMPSGQPFRLPGGRLLLRPGGHGSLLRNLEGSGGDLVFVKNIDNVLPDSRKEPTLLWKKILGGYLLHLQEKIFSALRRLEDLEDPNDEVSQVLSEVLGIDPATLPKDRGERRAFAQDRLHRPLRVCGVVVNRGEPGGGPYWVQGTDGSTSLQIVESAQIDVADPSQAAAFQGATHFNPVDLVCGLRDHRGQAFELARYQDPAAAFIAKKSHGGRSLRALEHPGLWNGAMARWNTVFVEVPAETFAPVKTVFDLLRPEHQS